MYTPMMRLMIFLNLTALGSIFYHYQGFVGDLFEHSLIFSAQDGSYLAALIQKLQGNFQSSDLNQAPFWQSFSGSAIYLSFLSEIVKTLSTRFGALLSQILGFLRTLNLLALGFIVLTLFLVFDKEKVRPIFRLIPIAILLCIPVLQLGLLQIKPDFVALALCLFGMYLYFQLDQKSNFWQSTAALGFLIAGLLLPARLIAVTPVLTCLLTAWIYGGRFTVQLSLIALVGLLLPLFNAISLHLPIFFLPWKMEYFQLNFSPLSAWSIGLLLLTLVWEGAFKFDFRQPSTLFLLTSFLFNLWETGTSPDLSISWLWTLIGAIWCLGRVLQLNQIQKAAPGLAFMLMMIGVGVHFFKPIPFLDNPTGSALIGQTEAWIAKFNQKKNANKRILSQDISFNLLTQSPFYLSDPSVLSRSPQAYAEIKQKIKAHFFQEIILANKPAQIWSAELVEIITSEYKPVQKLLVLGDSGVLYESPPPMTRRKRRLLQTTQDKSPEELAKIFATF
ncbi:MAG: hypothetical protein SFT81_02210 [Candidatus Caenarcaniphilales bacterium]|nr:hypothetical protein [Candidatus Caenarcaniphilales bacterium]